MAVVGKSVAKSLWQGLLGNSPVSDAISVDPFEPFAVGSQAAAQSLAAQQRYNLAQQVFANSQQNLQNLQAQPWHGLSAGQIAASSISPAPTITVNPLFQRAQEKLALMGQMLPMRVLQKIRSAQMFVDPLKFVVIFNNEHRLEFDDVDAFPSEEHIARIALECP